MSAPLTPATLVARTSTLASFPAIFHYVNEIIERPGSSAQDIGEALSGDPALCARLLRIVNSAFYAFPSRVDSIRNAVVIIGTRQIRDLMIATIALAKFKGIDAGLLDMRSFWRHSLATALGCRALARQRRDANGERAFICGLLHDVGSLLLYDQLPQIATETLRRHQDEGEPLHKIEKARLGFDHADVGAALLSSWRLPAFICQAAASHHRCPANGAHTSEVAGVHLADALAHALRLGSNGERLVPPLQLGVLDGLGWSPSCLEGVAGEVSASLSEAEQLFLGEPAA